MQLLIRARRFVGNPASTVSMNVNAVRDEPLTSNLIVVRNSGRRTPCKKQYDAPGCTGIYSFPIDRSPDARDS